LDIETGILFSEKGYETTPSELTMAGQVSPPSRGFVVQPVLPPYTLAQNFYNYDYMDVPLNVNYLLQLVSICGRLG
jgi:hypothetical protein